MTNEEKQLLLKDLCARLPYDIFVQVYYFGREKKEELTSYNFHLFMHGEVDILPYLRPMSSMTEEEREDYKKTFETYENIMGVKLTYTSYGSYDWLNTHHFDYRGLIWKGLALEAPDGMYKTE